MCITRPTTITEREYTMKFAKIALLAALPMGFGLAANADEIMATAQPAGKSVTIESLTITGDGWLVIHAIKDGKPVVPGSIGHVAVRAGTNKDVVVPLDVATKPGQKVLAMLHVDAGKKGAYEFPGADHPVMKDGKPVVRPIPIK